MHTAKYEEMLLVSSYHQKETPRSIWITQEFNYLTQLKVRRYFYTP